jgi:hypothetical protein
LRPNSRAWIRRCASLFSRPNKYLASFTPDEEDALNGNCLRAPPSGGPSCRRTAAARNNAAAQPRILAPQPSLSPRGRRSPSGADPPLRRIILVIADPAVGSGPYSSAGRPDSTSRHALVKAHRSARWLSLVEMLGSLRLIPIHLQMLRNDQDRFVVRPECHRRCSV